MNNKFIGQVLLWAGFVAGALATVWAAPEKGVQYVKELNADSKEVKGFELKDLSEIQPEKDGWHLVNWVWYSSSVAVAIVGIVLIRQGNVEASKRSNQSEASLAEIKESLHRLVLNVRQLALDSKILPPSKILSRIDDDLNDDFRVFADGRDSITLEYGLVVFADVMSSFAAGERSVNRAWSASADGYVNEAETCLERAEKMLAHADKVLNSAATV